MFVHPVSGTQTFQSEPRNLQRVKDWAEQEEIGGPSCRTTTRLSLAPASPGLPWRGDWWPAGRRVAIIERKLFGGTCVNTGCTPTKTLVASAYVAHVARRAGEYGVRIEGSVNVDMKRVKTRKDTVVAVFRNGVERSLKTLQGCTVYQGHGRFVAEKKVAVNGSELAADQIFINVGARAAIPPIPGLDQVPYLTNSSMINIDFLPSHLVILGGS